MYVNAGGRRYFINPRSNVAKAVAELPAVPDCVDVPFLLRRRTPVILHRIYSCLPENRKTQIVCYIDADGYVYGRYRLLGPDDARKVCLAVAYWEVSGPKEILGVLRGQTPEETVVAIAQYDTLRVLLLALGVIVKEESHGT